MPLLDPARADNFLYQPCSKDEKPWADQLAPELPPEATPADSAPAPVTRQDALPANPETASTEVSKPCPSPSAPHWPNAPDLPDDALPAKQEVAYKAAPKPRPLPSEPLHHEGCASRRGRQSVVPGRPIPCVLRIALCIIALPFPLSLRPHHQRQDSPVRGHAHFALLQPVL